MGRITQRRRVTRITLGTAPSVRDDVLAVEEPLEIRVGGLSLAITMRTPGHDVELAAGFLVSEAVIAESHEFAAARYCAPSEAPGALSITSRSLGRRPAGTPDPVGTPDPALPSVDGNTFHVLDVALAPGVPAPDPTLARRFFTTSSCGICGKDSIDSVRTLSRHPVADDSLVVSAALLTTLPDRLREQQAVFEKTGGLHAAALIDGATGELLVLREDVGRHNAVDKVVGWAVLNNRLPLSGCVLMVSGRASFELTQKASMAGIPMLAAVSAPSSLAADLATELGMTLVGFLRGESMVIYSGAQRIAMNEEAVAP